MRQGTTSALEEVVRACAVGVWASVKRCYALLSGACVTDQPGPWD